MTDDEIYAYDAMKRDRDHWQSMYFTMLDLQCNATDIAESREQENERLRSIVEMLDRVAWVEWPYRNEIMLRAKITFEAPLATKPTASQALSLLANDRDDRQLPGHTAQPRNQTPTG